MIRRRLSDSYPTINWYYPVTVASFFSFSVVAKDCALSTCSNVWDQMTEVQYLRFNINSNDNTYYSVVLNQCNQNYKIYIYILVVHIQDIINHHKDTSPFNLFLQLFKSNNCIKESPHLLFIAYASKICHC